MRSYAKHRWEKWAILVAMIAGLLYVFTAFPVGDWLQEQLEAIRRMGWLGYVWFVTLYVLLTVVWFPASILTLGAGAVFGIFKGTLLTIAGATLGAAASFLIGRYLVRETVVRRIAGNARFKAVDEAVGREGFKIVLLTRLSPVFPFVLLNYLYAITKVRLGDYVIASLIGMIPGTVLYVYLGSLAAMAATRTLPESNVRRIFTIVGLGLTIWVTVYVTRLARRALRDVEGKHA
ncbi:TVP38/TMEM64 family protein [bacterium]|nr:TVP38/TMEM64 family protein [bacterium]